MTTMHDTTRLYTAEGAGYLIRPLRPEDAPLLVELFRHMSPESRFRRFNQPLVNPDPAMIDRYARLMADVETDEGAAWLVFTQLPEGEGELVAGVRYMFFNPENRREAEVAITVRDDYQNQGIGTALLAYAAEQARAAGVERFTGLVQMANEPMWAIMRRLGLRIERNYDGSYGQVIVHLHEQTG
jgi:acetyltransferase